MRDIKVKVHPSKSNLKKEDQLAWKIAEIASDKAKIDKGVKPRQEVTCEIKYPDGTSKKIQMLCRIDTANEVEYYKNGGILQYVLRNMLAN